MTVLGIDTATRVCSAAIVKNGNVIAERSESAAQRHAELLMPFINSVFTDAEMLISDVEMIAVSIGPGSFTGLRIGLSTAKGIAAGAGKPVTAVPTMTAAANRVFREDPGAGSVSVVLPARRHEYYFARYKRGAEKPVEENEVTVYPAAELISLLAGNESEIIAGEGIVRLFDEIPAAAGEATDLKAILEDMIGKKYHFVTAVDTALLCGFYEESDVSVIEPLYIKDFYANKGVQYGMVQAIKRKH